jgi:glutaminyl-tRNA synthetase
MAEPAATAPTTAPDEEKGPSKRALEKAAKKAAAKAKKAELALRPKESNAPKPEKNASIFEEGWLKKVYQEKPVKDVITRFPPEVRSPITHMLLAIADYATI